VKSGSNKVSTLRIAKKRWERTSVVMMTSLSANRSAP
jgi:hypothetical protein